MLPSFLHLNIYFKLFIMDAIKLELEKALNNSFPMRGLDKGWCYAGNFYVSGNKYAYYGTSYDKKVTCRCMKSANYPNHWFEMKVDYEDDNLYSEPIITLGKCIG